MNTEQFDTIVKFLRDGDHFNAYTKAREFWPDREERRAMMEEASDEAQIPVMTGNHLIIEYGGAERLAEVRQYLDSLPDDPEGRRVRRSFRKQYAYLNEYGGVDSEGNRRFRVHLSNGGIGLGDMVFNVWWELRRADGTYKSFTVGGLVFHESDKSWSVHT